MWVKKFTSAKQDTMPHASPVERMFVDTNELPLPRKNT